MSIVKYGKKIGGQMIEAATGGLASGLGAQMSYGIGQWTGYNDKLKQDQLEQQQALQEIQLKGIS